MQVPVRNLCALIECGFWRSPIPKAALAKDELSSTRLAYKDGEGLMR
jgi:hypothetical protein